MNACTTHAGWPKVGNRIAALQRYASIRGLLLIRTHYFLTVIVGPVFGW
jgi:hypothetical protein